MLQQAWKRMRAAFAWEIDDEKSRYSINRFLINNVSGDRMIVMSRGCYQPICDTDWMADAANKVTIIGRDGRETVYDRAALDQMVLDEERRRLLPPPLPLDF